MKERGGCYQCKVKTECLKFSKFGDALKFWISVLFCYIVVPFMRMSYIHSVWERNSSDSTRLPRSHKEREKREKRDAHRARNSIPRPCVKAGWQPQLITQLQEVEIVYQNGLWSCCSACPLQYSAGWACGSTGKFPLQVTMYNSSNAYMYAFLCPLFDPCIF